MSDEEIRAALLECAREEMAESIRPDNEPQKIESTIEAKFRIPVYLAAFALYAIHIFSTSSQLSGPITDSEELFVFLPLLPLMTAAYLAICKHYAVAALILFISMIAYFISNIAIFGLNLPIG